MGRIKLNYSLYKRKISEKVSVYYYRTYKPDGTRTSGISTGCTSKSKAMNFCQNLYREGKLYSGESITFGSFAKDIFEKNSTWYKLKNQNNELSESYLINLRGKLNYSIMPYFKDKKLKSISLNDLIKFSSYLSDERKLKPSTINVTFEVLKIIIKHAIDMNVITINPFNLFRFKTLEAKKDAITLNEVKKIFNSEWKQNDERRYLFILSALTGLRRSELLGLRKSDFKDGFINLKEQFIYGKYQQLKNKTPRFVPVCDELMNIINSMDVDERIFPKSPNTYIYSITSKIKEFIPDAEERNITFHSLRHFFNTYMLSHNIPDIKVAMVMGHKSGISDIRFRYTNFKIDDYKDIMEEQKRLFHEITRKEP